MNLIEFSNELRRFRSYQKYCSKELNKLCEAFNTVGNFTVAKELLELDTELEYMADALQKSYNKMVSNSFQESMQTFSEVTNKILSKDEKC